MKPSVCADSTARVSFLADTNRMRRPKTAANANVTVQDETAMAMAAAAAAVNDPPSRANQAATGNHPIGTADSSVPNSKALARAAK